VIGAIGVIHARGIMVESMVDVMAKDQIDYEQKKAHTENSREYQHGPIPPSYTLINFKSDPIGFIFVCGGAVRGMCENGGAAS
jgi:hypothetical protein